jgi:hypothetical protein
VANPSKQKGTAWETSVVNWLRSNGHPYAERRTLAGSADKGDISGVPGVVLEAKNCRQITLAAWCDELEVEMGNAGVDLGAVVIKRRGTTDVGRAYAVMPMNVFVRLLGDDLGDDR